jgi:hypothetical protein
MGRVESLLRLTLINGACISDKSRTRSRPGTAASFLDDVCMFDSDDDAAETGAFSELDQFLVAYQTYGHGDCDRPLLWWKVFLSLQF